MSRTVVNFLLDVLLLLVLMALVGSALVVRFVFPAGTAANGWLLWGLDYDEWASVQFVTLCAILLAILVHVMLHWSWVCNVIASRLFKLKGKDARPDEGSQTLYGVATLIAILLVLGAFLTLASLSVQGPTG